jgi:hypothetical protein
MFFVVKTITEIKFWFIIHPARAFFKSAGKFYQAACLREKKCSPICVSAGSDKCNCTAEVHYKLRKKAASA